MFNMDLWAVRFLDNGAFGKRVLELKNYLHATDILDLVLREPSFFPPFFISHLIAVLTVERKYIKTAWSLGTLCHVSLLPLSPSVCICAIPEKKCLSELSTSNHSIMRYRLKTQSLASRREVLSRPALIRNLVGKGHPQEGRRHPLPRPSCIIKCQPG